MVIIDGEEVLLSVNMATGCVEEDAAPMLYWDTPHRAINTARWYCASPYGVYPELAELVGVAEKDIPDEWLPIVEEI